MRRKLCLALASGALATMPFLQLACSSSSSGDEAPLIDTTPAMGTYSGVASGEGQTGVIELTVAQGTTKPTSVRTQDLSAGDLPITGRFNFLGYAAGCRHQTHVR